MARVEVRVFLESPKAIDADEALPKQPDEVVIIDPRGYVPLVGVLMTLMQDGRVALVEAPETANNERIDVHVVLPAMVTSNTRDQVGEDMRTLANCYPVVDDSDDSAAST